VRYLSSDIAEIIKKFEEAGTIVKKIKSEILEKIVAVNNKIIDIAETIESEIEKLGGKPAFPVNIGIDNIAAHYTPLKGEETVVPGDKIIKVDFGVHIDGYPVDTAVSFYFGDDTEMSEMINTAKEAFSKALEIIRPGIDLIEIGYVIEDYVKERGFRVIENLNGHKLDKYVLHGEKEIPVSSKSKSPGKIEKDEVYALEIFVTKGAGWARSSDEIRIYSVFEKLPKRLPIHVKSARAILNYLLKERKSLPFTPRWLLNKFSEAEVKVAIATLESTGILIPYPVLIEKDDAPVAQYEETILITSEGAKILT